ncbi:DUF982 domain-containing protein [Rhizobiaceae bacterium n13]|nr:DUF982 domain-containing protein [Fererhizobium litorale]MDI7861904.1 DUF982 domain-containing protein [Fererhizobium litorale]
MADMLFDSPVFVVRGGCVQEVAGLDDAFALLDDWPEDRQDMVFEVVYKACRDAYVGLLPLSVSEQTFRQFSKRVGILYRVEEIPSLGTSGSDCLQDR